MIYPDEFLIQGKWTKTSMLVFRDAIRRYIETLIPLQGDGNTDIERETKDWSAILAKVREEINLLTRDSEQGSLPLLGRNYGKLFDILQKQSSSKKQLLAEQKQKILEEAAHQGATDDLQRLNDVLGLDFWQVVNRKRCLVDSFYPKDEPKTIPGAGLQVTIHNLYGMYATYNNGSMVQNNNSDVVAALQHITDALLKSELEEDQKQDALVDAQAVQLQLQKKKPNRSMIEVGLASLQVVANLAQIYQAVEPHFMKIQQFIQSLHV